MTQDQGSIQGSVTITELMAALNLISGQRTAPATRTIRIPCTSCAGEGFILQTIKLEDGSAPPPMNAPVPHPTPTVSPTTAPSAAPVPHPTPTASSAAAPSAAASPAALYDLDDPIGFDAAIAAAISPKLPPSVRSRRWYAVTVGTYVGVFTNWSLVNLAVSGVSGGLSIAYKTRQEAEEAYETALDAGAVKAILHNGARVTITR